MKMRWWFIQIVFALSGGCALAYEIVWGRWLVNVLGGSTMAACVVLTAYMGGLALGSWFFGRFSSRTSRPMWAYVGVEVCIGLAALLFPLMSGLLSGVGGSTRFVASIAMLLVPTFLMGGTVPLVMAWSEDVELPEGQTLGRLYGLNTVGAALGSLVTGFVLIPNLGLELTNLLAASINLFLGLILFVVFRAHKSRPDVLETSDESVEVNDASPVSSTMPLHVLAFLSGFVVLGMEVLWIRLLRITLGSTTYIFTLVITTFILGIGLGGLWAGRVKDEGVVRKLALAQLGLLALLFVQFLLLPQSPLLFSFFRKASQHWYSSIASAAGLCLLMLLPAAFVVGYLFPLLGRLYMHHSHRGSAVGKLYAVNTVGAVLGSLLTTLLLIPGLGTTLSFVMLSCMMLVSLSIYSFLARRTLPGWYWGGCVAVVGLLLWGGVAQPGWTHSYLGRGSFIGKFPWNSKVLYFAEGKNSTVMVVTLGSERGLFVDGKPVASSVYIDLSNQLLLGHLPALLTDRADTGLVVGLGTGMTLGSLSLHTKKHLELVELEPRLQGAARKFAEYNHKVMDNPKLKVSIDDGYNFMHATSRQYDVVTSDPIQPYFRGAATLYSVEYFRRASRRLTKRGVMAHWLPLANMSLYDFKMIVRSFTDVFPYASLYWTGGAADAILVGRNVPWEKGQISAKAFPVAAKDLASIYIRSPQEMAALRIADRKTLVQWAGRGVRNVVDLPTLEFTAPQALFTDTTISNMNELLLLRRSMGRKGKAWQAANFLLAYRAQYKPLPDAGLAMPLLYNTLPCRGKLAECSLVKSSGLLRQLLWKQAIVRGDRDMVRSKWWGRYKRAWWVVESQRATTAPTSRPRNQATSFNLLKGNVQRALQAYQQAWSLHNPKLLEEVKLTRVRLQALQRLTNPKRRK